MILVIAKYKSISPFFGLNDFSKEKIEITIFFAEIKFRKIFQNFLGAKFSDIKVVVSILLHVLYGCSNGAKFSLYLLIQPLNYLFNPCPELLIHHL